MNIPEISNLVNERQISDFDIGLGYKRFISWIIATSNRIGNVIEPGKN
jgi:hypothetical protein